MGFTRVYFFVACSIVLSACATNHIATQGIWHLSSPNGSSEFIEISKVSNNQFYIKGEGLPIDGLYRLEHDLLKMQKPKDARLTNYIWKLEKDIFTLIKEPPVRLTDMRLIGATLVKQEKI